jgi:hypothetical protein
MPTTVLTCSAPASGLVCYLTVRSETLHAKTFSRASPWPPFWLPARAWHCAVPTAPRWRNSGRHFQSKLFIYYHAVFFIHANRIQMHKNKTNTRQNANNGARGGLLKSALWVYSNPKWPVEWVANWSIIPPSASTRGQNRPPTPPPGGRGTPLNLFSGCRAPLRCNALQK